MLRSLRITPLLWLMPRLSPCLSVLRMRLEDLCRLAQHAPAIGLQMESTTNLAPPRCPCRWFRYDSGVQDRYSHSNVSAVGRYCLRAHSCVPVQMDADGFFHLWHEIRIIAREKRFLDGFSSFSCVARDKTLDPDGQFKAELVAESCDKGFKHLVRSMVKELLFPFVVVQHRGRGVCPRRLATFLAHSISCRPQMLSCLTSRPTFEYHTMNTTASLLMNML